MAGEGCCELIYWNYSPANNENMTIEQPVFYTTGAVQDVGGEGVNVTASFQALQQSGFLQQSTFPERRARVEAEVRRRSIIVQASCPNVELMSICCATVWAVSECSPLSPEPLRA